MRITLKNFDHNFSQDEKGKNKEEAWGIEAFKIWAELKNISGNSIKRVRRQVFANGGGEILFFPAAEQLFGWIASRGIHVEWGKSRDMITKSEFLNYISNVAESYDYAAAIPHYPNVKGFYYIDKIEPKKTGYLDGLIKMFNLDTEKDRVQLKAAFMTPFWGNGFGNRPGFLIVARDDDEKQGRGTGKTTITDAISQLCKGQVDLSKKSDDEAIRRALLSAKDIRVARLDNVKGGAFSSDTIESIVTSPNLSGHRMYVGHDLVPNIFTFFITFNDAELSADLSQRFMTIRVKRPPYDPEWLPKLRGFIETHREAIISDIGAAIMQPANPKIKTITRFPEWERDILSKCISENIELSVLHAEMTIDRESVDEMTNMQEEFAEICREKIAQSAGADPEKSTYGVRKSWVINWLVDFAGRKMSRKSAAKLLVKILPRGFCQESRLHDGIEYFVWSGAWHQGKFDFNPRGARRLVFINGTVESREWDFGYPLTRSGQLIQPGVTLSTYQPKEQFSPLDSNIDSSTV